MRKLDLFMRRTYEAILPDEKYRKRSKKLIKRVQNAITSEIKGSEVVVYGSQGYDVALPGSDVDFGVRMRDADFFEERTEAMRKKAVKHISKISHILEGIGIPNKVCIYDF